MCIRDSHPPEIDEQRDFRPFFGSRRSEADVTQNADDVRSSFRLDGCDAAGDHLVQARPGTQ